MQCINRTNINVNVILIFCNNIIQIILFTIILDHV